MRRARWRWCATPYPRAVVLGLVAGLVAVGLIGGSFGAVGIDAYSQPEFVPRRWRFGVKLRGLAVPRQEPELFRQRLILLQKVHKLDNLAVVRRGRFGRGRGRQFRPANAQRRERIDIGRGE